MRSCLYAIAAGTCSISAAATEPRERSRRDGGGSARPCICSKWAGDARVGNGRGSVGVDALTQFRDSDGLGSSVKIRAQQILVHPAGTRVDPARLVRVLAEAGRQLVLPRPLRETCEELLGFVEQAMPASRLVLLLREGGAPDPVQIAARYKGVTAREPLALRFR